MTASSGRKRPTRVERIVLTGFMGSGKSTTGRLVAEGLGWRFVDLDILIEERSGSTVPEIFARWGEERFRALEAEALAAALSEEKIVLALGGGAPESAASRALLENAPATEIIHLTAPFELLLERCAAQARDPQATARPNLADHSAARLRFERRGPLYSAVATLTVDCSTLTPAETAALILRELAREI